jgi:Ca2+-binding RTX toxin-like protein
MSSKNLQQASQFAMVALSNFASEPHFWQGFELAFGGNYDRVQAELIRQEAIDGSLMLPIRVLDDAAMGVAVGAFAAATNTIYLQDSFVKAGDLEAIGAVIVEELGHSIDSRVNKEEAPGDEGEIFRLLVGGGTISADLLAELKAEDDWGLIVVDGQELLVEMATIVGTSGDDVLPRLTDPDTSGADNIYGLAGNDFILGAGGDDLLDGGDGNDLLDGGDGADYLNDIDGTNTFIGGQGNDTIVGGVDSYVEGGDGIDNLTLNYSGQNAASIDLDSNGGGLGVGLDDTVISLIESFTFIGSEGNDSINASLTSYANSLSGNGGSDTLKGGSINDSLAGGADNDYLIGGAGSDNLSGDDGDDTIYGGSGDDANNRDGVIFSIGGLFGGDGNDVIYGEDGRDYVRGGDGNDIIYGGSGDDARFYFDESFPIPAGLFGGNGNDVIYGDAGNDSLSGDENNDTLDGGSGDDTLDGGAGEDYLVGGIGNDFYTIGATTDVVLELFNEGIDTVQSSISYSLGNNIEKLVLSGDALNGIGNTLANSITGNEFANILTGGDGDDTLFGKDGIDSLNGDDGNDTLYGGNDNDTLKGDTGNDYLSGDEGNDYLYGDEGNDTLIGGTGDDTLNSGIGNDSLNGGAGNDILVGGSDNDGLDILAGGVGDDNYGVYSSDTVVVEGVGSGADTIWTEVNQILGANIENLYLVGSINGTGNNDNNFIAGYGAGDNFISGLGGNDTLVGGDGNDTINGGADNDFLIGSAGNDVLEGSGDNVGLDTFAGGAGDDVYGVYSLGTVIVEDAVAGTDTVWTTVNQTLSANIENLYLVGATNGIGNNDNNLIIGYQAGDNVISGLGGNDTLDGGDGNDTLNGGTGNDYLIGGAGNDVLADSGDTVGLDTFVGGAGDDIYGIYSSGTVIIEDAIVGIDTVWTNVNQTLSANIENLYLVGAVNGTGNSGNNIIVGYEAGDNSISGLDGNDLLDGGDGQDSLNGGDGSDTLSGGSGADTFAFQFGQSSNLLTDRITDFTINADKISLFGLAGIAASAPTSFSRANDNTTATTLLALAQDVYADGAVGSAQELVNGGAAIVTATGVGIAGTYLIIDDSVAGFSSNDLVVNITGLSGTLPTFGSIPVNSFFN